MVGVPARQVGPQPVEERETCFPAYGTGPGAAVDPVARTLERLANEVERLNGRVRALEARPPEPARSEEPVPARAVVS